MNENETISNTLIQYLNKNYMTTQEILTEEILLLMQKLDTEIYNASDIELSEYFFQWCRITDILLQKLKHGMVSLKNST